jgi:polar amino acid transport system permease protein
VSLELSPLAQERLAYRRSRARRSTLVALVSTVVFAVALVVGVTSTPGWPRVQATFLAPAIAWSSLPAILAGLWLNIRVLVVTEIGVLALGLLIAMLRTLRGPVFFPLRALGTGYVDLFRGMPLLIALYLIGFGVPALRLQGDEHRGAGHHHVDPRLLGLRRRGVPGRHRVDPSLPALRCPLAGPHPSPVDASGDPPQAVRRVLPPLLNDFVALQKDVGLISVLGAVDAIRAAQIASARTFNFTPYVVAALLFVLLAVPTGRIADAVAARAARRQGST